MSEQKDNRGAVWKNKKREKETHPHWTGKAVIGGVEYWVSAWKKDDDAPENAPSISFSFKLKEDRPAARPAPKREASEEIPFDDEIPF